MCSLLHHCLEATAARFPDKEALVSGDERRSYREFAQHVRALAASIQRAGLARGDRVGVLLEPSAAQAIALYAVSRAGGVFVPMHPQLSRDQVRHVLTDCGVRGLITSGSKAKSLADCIENAPALEWLICSGMTEHDHPTVVTYDFAESCAADALPKPSTAIDRDLATIIYTSGTTGTAKGVMVTHAQLLAGARIVSDYLTIGDADRILCVLPLSFDAGLNQLLTVVLMGATIVLLPFVYGRGVVRTLLQERITGLAGVPMFWTLLVQPNSTLDQHGFPCLRYVTNTGGRMPLRTLAAIRRILPTTEVFLMYGLTEAFRSTYLPPDQVDQRPTSIGKAIPNTEIYVVREDGRPCEPGEIGELVHRGPTVSLGYWGHPELTAAIIRPNPFARPEIADLDRVCYSGDLVTFDSEGYLYHVGRRDNQLKVSGFRVNPVAIEDVLLRASVVRQAAVIGVDDELLGARLRAFVTPTDRDALDVNALLEFCRDQLPPYMVPHYIDVVSELPLSPTGKVDYVRLRQLPSQDL